MTQTLFIHHIEQQQFLVMRPDGKATSQIALESPESVQVEGRPNSHLQNDLRWYLEQFLDYPFPPNTEVAERVQTSLRQWGEACFQRLFQGNQAQNWYQAARSNGGLSSLTLKIASDDPRVLSWPWEALQDPEGTTLAHSCRIERQLSKLHDPLPLPNNLPKDRINLLLAIARPYGDTDVGYHALSRPLIQAIKADGLPVQVDVLRPPTFAQLEKRLAEKPGHYHIVHFDGHGGYGHDDPTTQTGSPYEYQGAQGRLIFEKENGEPDPIKAEKLTPLLCEHRIPIMVLNACQSARIDEQTEDPFASVAAALLKAGIRSVVAMGYNLYVSGAQQFVPAFYQRLLKQGDVAEATRAGRRAMLQDDARVCLRGEHPLRDWLVPVLYQQDAEPLPLAILQSKPQPSNDQALPEEAQDLGDYGFIGRQQAILALERAVQCQPQAGILIHGMAGVGKTTLAKGYLHWLQQTNGLGEDGFQAVFWFSLDEIRSAEFIINQLTAAFLGHNATALPLSQKLPALTQALKAHPFLLVWDNFESAAGIANTEVTPQLSGEDQQFLKTLLRQLRHGKSKVLLTSRSPESQLSQTEVYRLPLSGLQGQEQWEYCQAVVQDLGLQVSRDDSDYAALMKELDGHPLAMRAILLRLGEKSAPALLKELQTAFTGAAGDESTRRIFAALALFDQGLAAVYRPVLQLLGLHRRFVVLDYLAAMGQTEANRLDKEQIHQLFALLERGGLLHLLGNDIYQMHPALSSFLTERHRATETAQRGFVDFLGHLADHFAPKELHEQRPVFTLYQANFYQALAWAQQLAMDGYANALTQGLAAFAQNNRDFTTAHHLLESLAKYSRAQQNLELEAASYHQLGIIAQEQRDFATAESWYKKSLEIEEKQGNKHGMATSYHQLGRIAQEQRDFATAESWYKKSLQIKEKQGNEHGMATSYHQLGRIAQEQRDFLSAGEWFLRAIGIFGQNDPHYLDISIRNYLINLQAAGEQTRPTLQARWQEEGLEKTIAPLDQLEQQFMEQQNND